MIELDRLRTRIARLAEAPSTGNMLARVLANDGQPDAATAMQREIEETLLPRALTFSNDSGDVLILHVKAGRISMVAKAPHDMVLDHDLVGVALSGADAPRKKALFRTFGMFLKNTLGLSVESDLRAPDISLTTTGICPSVCFSPPNNIEQTPSPTNAASDLDCFATRCADIANAWIRVQGAMICERHGDPMRLSKLLFLAECELAEYADPPNNASPPANAGNCVIISSSGIDADAILSGNLGSDLIFMSFPAENLTEILDCWQSVPSRRNLERNRHETSIPQV